MKLSLLLLSIVVILLFISAPILRAQEDVSESDYDDAEVVNQEEQTMEEIVGDEQESAIEHILEDESDDLDEPLDIPNVSAFDDEEDEDNSSDEEYEELPGHGGVDIDVEDIPTVGAASHKGGNKNCHMTSRGVSLVKSFEGYRRNWYRDSVGVLTIGYGCTSACRGVRSLTEPQAAARLQTMLQNNYGKCVRSKVKKLLTTNQYNALTSFVYNLGCGVLQGNLLRELNGGRFSSAAKRMKLYNKAGGRTLAGLVRRRNAEVRLFSAKGPKCGSK